MEVVALVTTVNQEFDRVAMHAVRRELLEAQANSAGAPLWIVLLPWPCSNADYEARMGALCERAISQGVEAIAFGDLFLEDIRRYREDQLAGTGLEPLFPLWGLPTDALANTMMAAGLQARLTCVDPKVIPAQLAGREFDAAFLSDLPATADSCGERGEFHTFAYAGPMFSTPIHVIPGEIVERDGFVFADLLLDANGQ